MGVTHFAASGSLRVFFAAALMVGGAMQAQAAQPDPIWTPQIYNLGGPSLIPVVISTRVDTGDGEEDVTITGRRAPQSAIGTPDRFTLQSIFNVGGDTMRKPANCSQDYTTVAGQPGSAPDLAEQLGVRGCYF